MKTLRSSIVSLALIALLSHTCAKESDETLDEDESYVESMFGQKKEVVKAEWNTFIREAEKLISISESNLKTLHLKIKGSDDTDRKTEWVVLYISSRKQLDQLKEKFKARNLKFQKELKDYDGTSGKRNSDFKDNFLHDIVGLNKALEAAMDE